MSRVRVSYDCDVGVFTPLDRRLAPCGSDGEQTCRCGYWCCGIVRAPGASLVTDREMCWDLRYVSCPCEL